MTRPIPSAEFAKGEITLDTCWKRIGIQGDKTCPELPQHVHCRDCPTFSLAAATLLDRELPDQPVFLPVTARPAATAETECATIFRVGTEWFALPTRVVDEIVSARRVHSLPHKRNPALLGLVNIRGELVVCVAIAPLLLGMRGEGAEGRMIVVRHSGGRLACPVDEVQHTHRYAPDDLAPVPATVSLSASSLTRGLLLWQDRMVACLDDQALFDALGRSFA